jgi:hypothetical protein
MAKYGPGSVGFFLTSGFDLLSELASFNEDVEDILAPHTALGVTFEEHLPVGIRKMTLSAEGWYDDAADKTNAALSGAGQTSRVVCFGFTGNTIGKAFRGAAGSYSMVWRRIMDVAGLHKINADYSISGEVEEGQILHTLSAETANGDEESSPVDHSTVSQTVIPITSNSSANPSVVTTPVAHGLTTGQVVLISGVSDSDLDINGQRTVTVVSTTTFSVPVNTTTSAGTGGSFVLASTVNGGSGYLNATIVTVGGATNIVVTIRDSADDVTYANLLSFTALTALGAERVTVSGTINRYTAAQWSWTGGASSSTATFMVGLART